MVTTDADGPRQFVRHEEDGLITPIDDIDAMAGAIKRVQGDIPLREKMIKSGSQRYLQEFTKEKSVQAYLAYFADARQMMGHDIKS